MVEHQQAPQASLQGLGAQPSVHDSIYDFPWYNFFASNELEVSIDALIILNIQKGLWKGVVVFLLIKA
jgi:hypothetical protein